MSTLRADNWKNRDGSVQYYGAVAWVNFNGTGTVAIRASENVSSVTDNGTGDYSINFTDAMPDTNYAIVFGGTSGNGRFVRIKETSSSDTTAVSILSTSIRIWCNALYVDTPSDFSQCHASVFR